MPKTTISRSSLRIIASVFSVSCLTLGVWSTEAYPDTETLQSQDGQAASKGNEQQHGYTLLPTHRVITGVVESVAAEQAKVNHGEAGNMSPRYLSLERAKEKGFTLKAGDHVEIVVNEKNHVVDYHLVNGASTSDHRVIKGKLAQPMNVGQEHAVIQMQDGKKESFPVRPLARSEVAAIPLEKEALFLIDESKQISSAALKGDVKSEYDEKEIGWARTPAKNVYRHVDGVIQGKPSEQKLTIRTKHNQTIALPAWDYLKEDMAQLSEGMEVTLLVDRNDKVVNIAFPQKERN
jgi:hypothetical protein